MPSARSILPMSHKKVVTMSSRRILKEKLGGNMSALRNKSRLVNFVNGVVNGAGASAEVDRDVWVWYPHQSYLSALTTDMRRVREDVKKAKSTVTAEHARSVSE